MNKPQAIILAIGTFAVGLWLGTTIGCL